MRRSYLAVLISLALSGFVLAQSRGSAPSSSSSSSGGGGGGSHSSGSFGGSSSGGGGGGGYHSSGSSSGGGSSSSSSHSSASSSSSHSSGGSGSLNSSGSSGARSGSPSTSSTNSRSGGTAQPNLPTTTNKSSDKQMNAMVLKSNLEQQKGTVKVGETVKTKQPNRFVRFFLGKHENPEISKGPRPCVGKNCPPPPKPCKGAKCPPPPPPTNPPSCGPGTVSNDQGGCVAVRPAITNDCTNPLNTWCQQYSRQNDNRCFELLRQLSLAAQNARSLEAQKAAECSQNPQGTRCFLVTQKAQQAEEAVATLRRQLALSGCSSVGMLGTMPIVGP